jgi:hypothetical protein
MEIFCQFQYIKQANNLTSPYRNTKGQSDWSAADGARIMELV